MSNESIELLLERLININEAILDKLDDIKNEVTTIKDELDWSQDYSYAKIVNDGLNEITTKLEIIEMEVSSIESNTASA